jgi:hypothetical protein
MTRKMYTAICERSNGWWSIGIPEIRGAFSQARRLDQVEPMVRDVVALALQVPSDSFDVRVQAQLPEPSQQALARAAELRHEAQLAIASANEATVDAADILVARDGLTMREAGRFLGLSHQRIAQLLRGRRSEAAVG